MGKRVDVGKGGQKVGKRTGFSRIGTALNRLFPHKSTQVVDFPHKATARLFWGRPEMVLATDETRVKHGWGANLKQGGTGQTEERVNREPHEIREPIYRATFAWLAYFAVTFAVCILAAIFVTERSPMFAYVRVKSLMFAFFEKKYFFPALWLSGARAQWVGGIFFSWMDGRGPCILEALEIELNEILTTS